MTNSDNPDIINLYKDYRINRIPIVTRMQETDDTALVAGFSMPLFSGERNAGAVSTALAEKNQVLAQRDVMLLDYLPVIEGAHPSLSENWYITDNAGDEVMYYLVDW